MYKGDNLAYGNFNLVVDEDLRETAGMTGLTRLRRARRDEKLNPSDLKRIRLEDEARRREQEKAKRDNS